MGIAFGAPMRRRKCMCRSESEWECEPNEDEFEVMNENECSKELRERDDVRQIDAHTHLKAFTHRFVYQRRANAKNAVAN